MDFSSVLNGLLERNGVTAYRLSKDTGISQSLISDWKKGKSIPNSDKLDRLALYFGVSADYLLGRSQATGDPIPSSVPILGVIRAGLPLFCDENVEGYEFANVKHPEDYFYLRVRGDSMQGAGIPDGSLVLIRRQDFAEDGQIVACLVDGESATLKRFRRQGDMIALLPENSAYQPIFLQAADFGGSGARVLGVAVSVTREL